MDTEDWLPGVQGKNGVIGARYLSCAVEQQPGRLEPLRQGIDTCVQEHFPSGFPFQKSCYI